MDSLDAVVIGAGVVGLAVGQRLARQGRRVVVLEAEAAIGKHASSRNSEVIHAGIYYPPGSLKARLCVSGRRTLYAYLGDRGVPHRPIGKVLVAVHEDEVAALERYRTTAEANGVTDLVPLDASAVTALEPEVVAVRGLLSPSTGIVDSHALMRALKADIETAGGDVVVSAPVLGGYVNDTGIVLDVGGVDPIKVHCTTVINAAGLFAARVARTICGVAPSSVPVAYFAQGHYFLLARQSPFKHLVYPMPTLGGLGIHVTLDLAGGARFGPDIAWGEGVSYAFDEGRAAAFYRAIRTYYPGLPDGALQPGYVGVRPKIVPEGMPAADFVFQGPETHGAPGLLNLYGIESPGLTACLAIADEVVARLP
jgi:L-2-hydroxyglutarate oxidase LhgO